MLRIIYLLHQVYLWFARPLTLGVRVMLIRDGQVLLIRQTYMDGWFMPGGGIGKRETPEQAARREVHEEVDAEIGAMQLLGAYSNFKELKSDHTFVFVSENFRLGGGHDREVAEMRFFPLDALPAGLKSGHRQKLEEYARNPTAADGGPRLAQLGEW
jgi:8-oxo-dGTP pyrophosphatase MutT (NUDIX family)